MGESYYFNVDAVKLKRRVIAPYRTRDGKPKDFVFDPFLGSGTTAVVAKKLDRSFAGVEINSEYCCWAEKRLARAEVDAEIQGYADGVFWERNSLNDQLQKSGASSSNPKQGALF